MDSQLMALCLRSFNVSRLVKINRLIKNRWILQGVMVAPTKVIAVLFSMLLSVSVLAGDPPIFSPKGDIAVRGTDVVAYFDLPAGKKAVKGSPEFSTKWNGAEWRFSSAENLAKFKKKPEAYAPQYGGYCAFAVSHGFTKSTDPDAWYIEKDKLYLNYSNRVQKKWLKDVPGNIVKADKNWPKVLD